MTSIPPVDPLDDRAVYKQIADQLRTLLDAGELRGGDKLPSESALMRRFGTSRATIRNALAQLTQEGRIRTERGVGVFVADAKRLINHDPADFLRHGTNEVSPLERDAHAQGFDYRQAVTLGEIPAPEHVAELLELATGDQVFARKRVVSTRLQGARWQPAKIADSYLPLDVATGRIRERDTGPGGTYARIGEQGHQLTHFDEHLIFRMPDPSEARTLRLGAGVPVIDQIRVAYAGGRPVECFLAVLAGDKLQIEYSIPTDVRLPDTVVPPNADTVVSPGAKVAQRGPRTTTEIRGTVELASDRPVYKQIADLIRDHIDRGELIPGDRLPSESALMRHFDVTRTTIRRAIQALAAEGRVRTERGVGAFVKEVVLADALVRQPYDRLARHHYRDEGRSGLEIDAESRGYTHRDVHQDRVELADVRAPGAVAKWLKVEPGTHVFRRRRRMWMGDMPTQLTDSYMPTDLAVGKLREEFMGEGGAHARLEELGHRLTHFVERLSVRMPYPHEARALRLEQGVPVVDLYQTAYADDRPVECFVSVIAGDRYVFTYRIDA
ncbi:MAG TPA: GntR family transcriptional regulator [Euzebyales bacterium]|nr:GntR family transcriptional regulator [Euzebyales bacterium]